MTNITLTQGVFVMLENKPKQTFQSKIFPYDQSIEQSMLILYTLYSEKDKRLYAAGEALKLGFGGITYIAKLFNCDRKTIGKGLHELTHPETIEKNRIRKKGGGRKKSIESIPNINEAFLKVVYLYTAGDPMDDRIRWTNLTHQQVADRLEEMGIFVSKKIAKNLFKKNGFVKRKAQKSVSAGKGDSKERNEQFEIIASLRAKFEAAGNPIISMDTKKKEALGNLYRSGSIYTTVVQKVFDHDFPHLADGIVIPHGLYDVLRNTAYVNIGTSKDTSEFACESIRQWWHNEGQYHYSNADSILLLCDAGGSNSYRHYIFKFDIQNLANELGIEIRIAHYPSYASKWNPIEHRLFCHVTRALQGVIFKSHKLVKDLVESTTTKKGLTVTANIIKSSYEIGRKVPKGFKETMKIIFDEQLGKWNYKAVPQKA